jgi:hypothetical protein
VYVICHVYLTIYGPNNSTHSAEHSYPHIADGSANTEVGSIGERKVVMDYLAIFCMRFCRNKYVSITILFQTSEG